MARHSQIYPRQNYYPHRSTRPGYLPVQPAQSCVYTLALTLRPLKTVLLDPGFQIQKLPDTVSMPLFVFDCCVCQPARHKRYTLFWL